MALHIKQTRRHAHLIFFLVFLVTTLACGQSAPEDLSALELRQTMAALPAPTLPAGQPVIQPTAQPVGEQPSQPQPQATLTVPAGSPVIPVVSPVSGPVITYLARSGDTLPALAGRFGVEAAQIQAPQSLPGLAYLPLGIELSIPNVITETVTSATPLLPDSEIVYSPAAAGFDLAAYIQQAGGFLSTYQEEVDSETLSGAAIIQRVADELSVNPRLLVAFLEYRSGWVLGQPRNPADLSQPIGFNIPDREGLYQEMMIVATQVNVAYYGWRQGTFTTLTHGDSSKVRLNPQLNPGSVAVQHLLAMFFRPAYWQNAVYGADGFLARYAALFGDPWVRAVEPLLPPDLAQPALELPYLAGEPWALTAGPHNAWNAGTPRGALDFSPITGQPKCQVSVAWATAAAPGLVVRSAYNAVALDLDGDGLESTGWVLVYLHIADLERTTAPLRVALDDRLGHPSCEGGRATGTHLHLARKYNGEWLAADGPTSFVLSGWQAVAGELNYTGSLVRLGDTVKANPGGETGSTIIRGQP